MPEPGVVRQPEYNRGSSLPYGGATQANAMDPEAIPPMTPEEEFLYGPTLRPEEPITAGAPFGPGPVAPPAPPRVPDTQFLAQAIARLPQQNLPPRVQEFLRRVEAGE